MKYDIGVMSAVFMESLDDSVEKIAKNGFNLIELSGEQFESFVTHNKNGIDKLNDLRKGYDLKYTVHGPLVGLMLDWPEEHIRKASIQRLKNYIKMTSEVGSELLVLHPVSVTPFPITLSFHKIKNSSHSPLYSMAIKSFLKFNHYTKEGAWRNYEIKKVFKSILEAYEEAESKKVSISCENLFYGFEKPEDFKLILDEDRKYLNFTFDPAHALMAKKDEMDWIGQFYKNLDHVHAVDTDGHEDKHPIVGTGKVEWPKLMRKLNEVGYKGNMILENYTVENAIASKSYLNNLMEQDLNSQI